MKVVNGMARLQVDVVIFVVGVRAVFVKKRRDTVFFLINAPEKILCIFRTRKEIITPLWRYIGAAHCNWNDMLPVCFEYVS